MTHYALVDDNITACDTLTEARRIVESEPKATFTAIFSSLNEFERLPLQMSQLVSIWNAMAGAVPFDDLKRVKKFKSREVAIKRIWDAIQRLLPVPIDEPQPVKTVPSEARKGSKKAKTVPSEARKGSKKAKIVPSEARKGSKKAKIVELLRRPEGATLSELMQATGWQAHTVRGFLSGTLAKKMGHKVARRKRDDGTRVYFLTK
jgi:hypothetical protein